jgi:colicin import membrane protein
VKLPDKTEKTNPKPSPNSTIEPTKTIEKPTPTKKSDSKPEPEKMVTKTEKKTTEAVKPQEKNSTAKKSQQEKKPTETAPRSEKPVLSAQQPTIPPTATTKEKKMEESKEAETEEREKQILAAMEKIRAAEETTKRERDIAAAVDRVRKNATEKGEGEPSNQKVSRSPRQDGEPNGKVAGEGIPGGGYGTEFLAYTQRIKQRVKEAWIVTERKPGLSTVVRFGVDVTGEVIDVELAGSSGDRAFDQTALRAVRKANPLPPPPEAYREEFLTQKVEITFSGEEWIK